jgi:hypothetical protein
MGWLRKIGFCAVALVPISTKAETQLSGSLRYIELYAVEGLAVGKPVNPNSWQYRRFTCKPSEQYAKSMWCDFHEKKRDVHMSILHSADNNVVSYINEELPPASLTDSSIEKELAGLSQLYGTKPRIFRSPNRRGSPRGIIATWGDIELQPLARDDLAMLAEGKNPQVGVVVDFLVNFHESAKAGLPVYSLRGSKGYVWIASSYR